MKKFILICAMLLCIAPAQAQNQNAPNMPTEAQMKAAREMMNSPEYQQKMQRAMGRMKQQGVDPATLGATMMNPKAMEAGMGMSACMQKTPGNEGLNRIAKRAEAIDGQIQALCKLNKRDEANKMQKEHAAIMLADPDMIAIRACAEQFKDKLNDPSLADFRKQIDALSADKQQDACAF